MPVAKTLMRVTRAAARAKATITKVKRAVSLVAGVGKGEGSMSSMAWDEVHLLGVARCFSLLEDSVPSKIKE